MKQLYFLGIKVSNIFKVQQTMAWMEAFFLSKAEHSAGSESGWPWSCDMCVQFLILWKSSGGYFCLVIHTMGLLLSYFPGSPPYFCNICH